MAAKFWAEESGNFEPDELDASKHRGGFGEFGGESQGFIERTFREKIVLVGVTSCRPPRLKKPMLRWTSFIGWCTRQGRMKSPVLPNAVLLQTRALSWARAKWRKSAKSPKSTMPTRLCLTTS